MQPRETISGPADENDRLSSDERIQVVVGSFATPQDACRVAASLRGPQIKLQRVSRRDPLAPSEMPDIIYEEIEDIDSTNVVEGMLTGGAIGAGSGLLLLGLPAVGTAMAIAAPFAGLIAGAWIGGVAGVDEARRGIELPNNKDYQKMLSAGKSFVVIAGDETERREYGKRMKAIGAEEIFYHPPIQQAIRTQKNSKG